MHGKRPHNPFYAVVPSKILVLFVLTRIIWGSRWRFGTFVVPVLQGYDLCDTHEKRRHNPFRTMVPSKFPVCFDCKSHYWILDGGVFNAHSQSPFPKGFTCVIYMRNHLFSPFAPSSQWYKKRDITRQLWFGYIGAQNTSVVGWPRKETTSVLFWQHRGPPSRSHFSAIHLNKA